ncbi:conserved hypothetical protein [Histoplasma capsulatum H143]|uniref:Uncharacterized protein n=1 Tax=Ajellomyces capsulatus (strain H143) TaxID=544712 RepID=C6H2G3_AJECH|nr:conserved hypothetical protein [Histoplasma capsulatum H143]
MAHLLLLLLLLLLLFFMLELEIPCVAVADRNGVRKGTPNIHQDVIISFGEGGISTHHLLVSAVMDPTPSAYFRKHSMNSACHYAIHLRPWPQWLLPSPGISPVHFLSDGMVWLAHGASRAAETKRANEFNPKRWGLDVADARRLLENIPDWVAYTTKAQSGMGDIPSFGRYDLLDGASKIRSPIVLRYRDLSSRTQHTEPEPPTPASRTIPLEDLDERFSNFDIGSEDSDLVPPSFSSEVYISPRSPMSAGNSDQFPPADDEQTVTTALLLLIKAVCLSNPTLNMAWTMERKAFIFKTRGNGEKIYEARTDGHLHFNNEFGEKSLAILEVKAGSRWQLLKRLSAHSLLARLMAIHGGAIVWSLRDHRRQWQESAQMAAWIRSEPDQPTQDGRYRVWRQLHQLHHSGRSNKESSPNDVADWPISTNGNEPYTTFRGMSAGVCFTPAHLGKLGPTVSLVGDLFGLEFHFS